VDSYPQARESERVGKRRGKRSALQTWLTGRAPQVRKLLEGWKRTTAHQIEKWKKIPIHNGKVPMSALLMFREMLFYQQGGRDGLKKEKGGMNKGRRPNIDITKPQPEAARRVQLRGIWGRSRRERRKKNRGFEREPSRSLRGRRRY